MNIQQLESLNDVIERITCVRQSETVPDDLVREADQIELVHMSPEACGAAWPTGTSTSAERVDAALANYFRAGGGLTVLMDLPMATDEIDTGGTVTSRTAAH